MTLLASLFALVAAPVVAAPFASVAAPFALVAAPFAPVAAPGPPGVCAAGDPDGPAYYAIDLVTTRRVPGSRMAGGTAAVTYTPSPFGVSLAADGSYALELSVAVERLAPAARGAYVVWVTRPDLSRVERLGALDATHRIRGRTAWNKFLVVVSLEEDPSAAAERWTGPIVLRGMSRSGRMHTMAGHGPFQAEPCAVYGFR